MMVQSHFSAVSYMFTCSAVARVCLGRGATHRADVCIPFPCARGDSTRASNVRGVSLGLKRCVCLSSSMAWVGGGSKLASSLDRWGNLLMLSKLFPPLLPSCLPKIGVVVDLVEKIPPLAAAQAKQRFKSTGTRGTGGGTWGVSRECSPRVYFIRPPLALSSSTPSLPSAAGFSLTAAAAAPVLLWLPRRLPPLLPPRLATWLRRCAAAALSPSVRLHGRRPTRPRQARQKVEA